MQQNSLNAHTRPSSRRGAARTLRATSGAVAVTTILGLLALTGAGCDGEDTTAADGGAGGSGGSAGSAGSSGSGGSAGSSGSSGGGAAGAAGAGGAAGSAGSAGNAGSAGDGGSDGDAGVTDAGGDAASGALTRQQIAEGICERLAAVPECTPLDDCLTVQLDAIAYYDFLAPECPEVVTAYISCLATAPQDGFECTDEDAPGNAPETCSTELDAMNAGLATPECCPECE